jgi:hypothetical protein
MGDFVRGVVLPQLGSEMGALRGACCVASPSTPMFRPAVLVDFLRGTPRPTAPLPNILLDVGAGGED